MTRKDWRAQEYPFPETRAAATQFFQQPCDRNLAQYIPARHIPEAGAPMPTNRRVLDFIVTDLRDAVSEDYPAFARLSAADEEAYNKAPQLLSAVEAQVQVLDAIVAGELPQKSQAFALVDEEFRGALQALMRIERGDFLEKEKPAQTAETTMEAVRDFMMEAVTTPPDVQAETKRALHALDQLAFGLEALGATFVRENSQQRFVD